MLVGKIINEEEQQAKFEVFNQLGLNFLNKNTIVG